MSIRPPRAISNDVTLSKNERAGVQRHELAGGVVDVGIDLVLVRHHPAVAEDAVLGVQDHVAALEVVRHHRGDADAEIHVGAFLDEPGRVPRDALARQRRLAVVEARLVRGPSRRPAPGLAVDARASS